MTKLTVLAVVIAAVAIVVVALRKDAVDAVGARDSAGTQGGPSASSASPVPGAGDDESDNDGAVAPSVSTALPREPTYAQPAQLENLLLQLLARQPGLEAVALSVSCDAARCEIALQGQEISPAHVGAYSDLFHLVLAEPWQDFLILSAGIGTREIAPGVRENVIDFEYQAYEDLSDDPTIAARQQAACAAAWRRQTENPAPDDVVRSYLEEADRRLALTAAVLGRAEAERVVVGRLAIRGGPRIRECLVGSGGG